MSETKNEGLPLSPPYTHEVPELEDAPSVGVIQNTMREIKRLYPNWSVPRSDNKEAWHWFIWDWRCNLQGFPVDELVSVLRKYHDTNNTAPSPGDLWVTLDHMRENEASPLASNVRTESVAANAMAQMRRENPQMFRGK